VAHQIYKGCSSWIKKDSATNAEKDLNMKRRKDMNGAKVVPGINMTVMKMS
jgi:hypothetical protein